MENPKRKSFDDADPHRVHYEERKEDRHSGEHSNKSRGSDRDTERYNSDRQGREKYDRPFNRGPKHWNYKK